MTTTLWQRTVRVGTALGLLSTSLTTMASASQVRYRDYGAHEVRIVRRAPSHSNTGAILGGFVGGLVLGAVLGSASQAHAQAQYVYEDPYTNDRYPSYDAYLDQCRYESHPQIVRVIDQRSGQCVRTCRYDEGRWVDTQWNGPADYGYGGVQSSRGGDRCGRQYSNWARTWDRERGYDRRCNDDRGDNRRYGDDRNDRGRGDQGWDRGDDDNDN